MHTNHLLFAWRHLVKDHRFTLLNLFGLASGLACALLIWLWIRDESSVDAFHQKGGQLYQVMQNIPLDDGNTMTTENTPDPLAAALTEKIPEIQEAVIAKTPDADGDPQGVITFQNQSIKAVAWYVTPNFFHLFSFPILSGNKNQALTGTSGVLISDGLAMKLFHTSEDLAGKTIAWNWPDQPAGMNGLFTITGVFQSPPASSSLHFDLLFPHSIYADNNKSNLKWNSSNPSTFVLLKSSASVAVVNEKVKDLIKARYPVGSNQRKYAGTLFLQKFSEKYLHNRYFDGAPAGGRIDYLRIFSIIAIFILVIACINFMNLSTAQAAGRMKEVGIRKVIGATRATLIGQYLGESLLMTMLAVVLAIGLVFLLLPSFRVIAGKDLAIVFDRNLLLTVAAITLGTSLFAGSYPALYLSGFRPIAVLKGRLATSASELWVRKGLVTFQFVISAVLIVAVIVVYQQSTLIQTKDLGYNKDNVIRLTSDGKIRQDQQAFIAQLKGLPGVVNASELEGDMVGNHAGGGGIDWPGKANGVDFGGLYVDYDFMQTMGLEMKEGRMFSRDFGVDSNGVIFNETAIAAMGLKDPIGKKVSLWGVPAQIIGVVKDFHYESLYKKVGPFFFSFRRNTPNIIARIRAGSETSTLAEIEGLYKKYNPGLPFEYKFLDEDYTALYASEKRVALLSRYFAGIAIIISCLGLFGLAAFAARKRQKEMGIRKVVGASVQQLAFLLSRDLLQLVVVAVLIAFPLAWWATEQWLRGFAYRVHIGAGVYLLAAGAILLITLATVGAQSIKAALANPVKSLHAE